MYKIELKKSLREIIIGMTAGILMSVSVLLVLNMYHIPPNNKAFNSLDEILLWTGLGMLSKLFHNPSQSCNAFLVGAIATIGITNHAYNNVLGYDIFQYDSLGTAQAITFFFVGFVFVVCISYICDEIKKRDEKYLNTQ